MVLSAGYGTTNPASALYPTNGHNIIIVPKIIGVNIVSCDCKHVIIVCSMYVLNEIRNAYIS